MKDKGIYDILRLCNAVYEEKNVEVEERLHLPLPQEKQPRNHKELQGYNSYSRVAKVYNAQFINNIRLKVENFFLKIRNIFGEIA